MFCPVMAIVLCSVLVVKGGASEQLRHFNPV